MRSVLACLVFAVLPLCAAAADYVAEIDAARAQRVERLTKPDGWLTLIGLHYLQPGPNTVGKGKKNTLVLAAGPKSLGTVTLSADGTSVSFSPAAGVPVTIDGKPAPASARLVVGDETHSLVASGTVSFFVLERGGRKALRVKDSAAKRRVKFKGIEYFPTDPAWRIEAKWMPYDPPREIPVTNVAGMVSMEKAPGRAVFVIEGSICELTPVLEGPGEPLFFIFGDSTNGEETYGMRFLYAEPPKDGKITLDFNRAFNPPCAFTPFATCPTPPDGNRLTRRVSAGEKKYAGSHD
jgi:uncharacterized protein (DUF1684 family)